MNSPTITIREEQRGDEAAIARVLEAAFPTAAEGRLVEALRQAGRLTVSLVALADDQIVGHIAFSPVAVGPWPDVMDQSQRGVGLAPLAVLPACERQGIGTALVRQGLAACRAGGWGFVVVLGEPDYYRRFGFRAAARWGLSDEYGGGEAFQALELEPDAIPPGGGLVQYAPEFALFGE